MTRKDYKLIAETFARFSNDDNSIAQVALALALALDKANTNFDYDKFVEACGDAING